MSSTLLVFFGSSFVCLHCSRLPNIPPKSRKLPRFAGDSRNVPWSRQALTPSSPATPRGRYLKRPRHLPSANAKTYYYIAVCSQQQKVHLIQCSRYLMVGGFPSTPRSAFSTCKAISRWRHSGDPSRPMCAAREKEALKKCLRAALRRQTAADSSASLSSAAWDTRP